MHAKRLISPWLVPAAGLLLSIPSGHPGAAAAAERATLRAGAAVADITPPAAGEVPPPPAFASCSPSYDGPRRFAFEEPYIDQQGLGHFEPGDPYCDANGNGHYDGIYLGGGSGQDRVPTSILDPISAQA